MRIPEQAGPIRSRRRRLAALSLRLAGGALFAVYVMHAALVESHADATVQPCAAIHLALQAHPPMTRPFEVAFLRAGEPLD